MLDNCIVALVLGIGFVSVQACDFPPSLWCTSNEIAKNCQVETQCAEWNKYKNVQSWKAEPVAITLYYESMCPDCKQVFAEQLYPTWKKLAATGILDLNVIPYGNAHEKQNGTMWEFDCQHGPDECLGNIIEECAMHLYHHNLTLLMPFLVCIEQSQELPATAAKQCAQDQGLDYARITGCATGDLGNQLEHKLAVATEALDPPHQYVPWFTLNGVHTEDIQNQAQENLLKLICDTYKGPQPEACTAVEMKMGCYKGI